MPTHPDSFYEEALNKAKISPNSKYTYQKGIQRIQALLTTKKKPNTIHYIITHAPQVYPILEENIKEPASLKTTLASILAYLKHSNTKQSDKKSFNAWYSYYEPLKKQIEEQVRMSKPTKRQLESMVKWGDVIKARDNLAKTHYASRDHLILAMYTYLPPRRQEDYYQVYVIQKRPYPKNLGSLKAYLDLTSSPPTLAVNVYKTAKAFSSWEKKLPTQEFKPLLDIIKKSLQLTPRDYLFTQVNGQPYEHTISYTRFSNRVFKKYLGPKVTLNSIRHAAVKASLTDEDKTYDEQSQYAKDMGHGFDTHRKYKLIDPSKRIKITQKAIDPTTNKEKTYECECIEKPTMKKAKKK